MNQSSEKNECADRTLEKILAKEVALILKRRKKLNEKRTHKLNLESLKEYKSGKDVLDVVALAFSGGGIRSASFCLGATQALHQHEAIDRIDYLSTVSGGGYIGASLTASLTETKEFPFAFPKANAADKTRPIDISDTESVKHIRNYSNYLIPRGLRDVFTSTAVIIRGLIANTSLVLPFVLIPAALTIFNNPERKKLLKSNFFGYEGWWIPDMSFGFTLLAALFVFIIFLVWALIRSNRPRNKLSEVATPGPVAGAWALGFVAAVFLIELQPFFLEGLFDLAAGAGKGGDKDKSILPLVVQSVAVIATPIAGMVALFRRNLAIFLKSVMSSSSKSAQTLAIASQAAFWIAGAALPLLIWIGYLQLSYWGIANVGVPDPVDRKPPAIYGTVKVGGPGIELTGSFDCQKPDMAPACAQLSAKADIPAPKAMEHAPNWLIKGATAVKTWIEGPVEAVPAGSESKDSYPEKGIPQTIALLYTIAAVLLLLISLLHQPNANSLHRLYRDRLSKAFLFNQKEPDDVGRTSRERELKPLDGILLSDLIDEKSNLAAPYHLINAALNVQGSDFANRRGRNADFFLFSPAIIGSQATGYAETREVEKVTTLDLATAMAISGAAFSSNMGSKSIRALTPTLALLNVRTGYWLRNPGQLPHTDKDSNSGQNQASWMWSLSRLRSAVTRQVNRKRPQVRHWIRKKRSFFFLWAEISGLLYEDSEEVYLTDGGHIENLGIYELLRRRCKVIVAIDAEADPAMRFGSFITLQRYARIDLGVRINLPWDKIRDQTLAHMGDGTDPPHKKRPGPHGAIGTIDYGGGSEGYLLYIKSSLSGDENDYIRDYTRRFAKFPHETTGDQFFSEEQFEVYRALGFHIVNRLLTGEDYIQVTGKDDPVKLTDDDERVKKIRQAILGDAGESAATA